MTPRCFPSCLFPVGPPRLANFRLSALGLAGCWMGLPMCFHFFLLYPSHTTPFSFLIYSSSVSPLLYPQSHSHEFVLFPYIPPFCIGSVGVPHCYFINPFFSLISLFLASCLLEIRGTCFHVIAAGAVVVFVCMRP